MIFVIHTRSETLETFDTLQDANLYAVEHATPGSGVAVTLPQGGQMSLWDFRAWSSMALRFRAHTLD